MRQRISATGVRASTLYLPPGSWTTVLDCLCAQFPAIGRAVWLDRMARGLVYDAQHNALDAASPHRAGLQVFYFREVPDEPAIAATESVLHVDEHLIVVDKPHFLPVIPSGGYVEQTLLSRLLRRFGNAAITPLHRIDRLTAGLVLFSADRASRARYQALFRERNIEKYYEAIAPALPLQQFPLLRRNRLVEGEPFFRMRECDGAPNSETRIEVVRDGGEFWRYGLYPRTGKKHQLRVHMAALGAPICNDPCYPVLVNPSLDNSALDTSALESSAAEHLPAQHRRAVEGGADDYRRPLKLLAKALAFIDPLSGERRNFRSLLDLE